MSHTVDGLTLEQWMAEALALGLPPSAAINSLKALRLPRAGRRLVLAIERDLGRGVPLFEALGRRRRGLDASFVAVVESGEQGGNLEAATQAYLRNQSSASDSRFEILRVLAYPALCLLICVGALLVALRTAAAALEPAGDSLDHWAVLSVAGAPGLAQFRIALLASGVGALVLILVAAAVARRPGWLGRLLHPIPGLRRLVLRRQTADIAEALARMLRAGHPLGAALTKAARLPGGRRLRRAADRVEAGVLPSEALATAGTVGRRLSGPVALTGARSDIAESLLREAHSLRGEAQRREGVLRTALWGGLLVYLAVAVGWAMLAHLELSGGILGALW